MATKTIGITEEVYERLVAAKHEDESFTETIDRLLTDTQSDWRQGFGRWSEEDTDEVSEVVTEAQRSTSLSTSRRTDDVLEAMGFELDEDGNVVSRPEETDERDR